jgi:ribosomal protein S18 acetylase RimI-like enzyme
MAPDDLARTIAFERGLQERVSTRLVPFAFGTAYLNGRYRVRWDSNLLWVERDAPAPDLIAEADRILGGAGLSHREIRVDVDVAGKALATPLAAAGYGCDRIVVMRLERAMEGSPAAVGAEEIDLDTLRPTLETMIGREPWGDSEETVRTLAAFRRELVLHAGARFFCARVDDEIASVCELYQDGPVAQIEDVNTLQEFRNRGLGRAVVRQATVQALADGADLIFIHALDDDWPKGLYARLGFEPIGHVWSFVRPSWTGPKSPA